MQRHNIKNKCHPSHYNGVANFIFLGTSYNESQHPNILTYFKNAIHPIQNDVRLLNGIGSLPEYSDDEENISPGQYRLNKHGRRKRKSIYGRNYLGKIRAKWQQIYALFTGNGSADLQNEVLDYLHLLAKQHRLPQTVNLYGFSRGADTAVRLSNLLYLIFPDIKLNLFLIDDVPGAQRGKSFNSKMIPPNVNELTSLIFTKENRLGFEPQDHRRFVIASPEKTHFYEKHYPAVHDDHQLKNNGTITGNLTAYFVRDDLIQFANRNGTQFKDNDKYFPLYEANFHAGTNMLEFPGLFTPLERLHLYHMMKKFESKKQQLIRRSASRHLSDFIHNTEFFINKEHVELFKKIYPAVYSYAFQGNIEHYSDKKIKTNLKKMLLFSPLIIDEMKALFSLPENCQVTLQSIKSLPLMQLDGNCSQETLHHVSQLPQVTNEYQRFTYALQHLFYYLKHRHGFSKTNMPHLMALQTYIDSLMQCDYLSDHKKYELMINFTKDIILQISSAKEENQKEIRFSYLLRSLIHHSCSYRALLITLLNKHIHIHALINGLPNLKEESECLAALDKLVTTILTGHSEALPPSCVYTLKVIQRWMRGNKSYAYGLFTKLMSITPQNSYESSMIQDLQNQLLLLIKTNQGCDRDALRLCLCDTLKQKIYSRQTSDQLRFGWGELSRGLHEALLEVSFLPSKNHFEAPSTDITISFVNLCHAFSEKNKTNSATQYAKWLAVSGKSNREQCNLLLHFVRTEIIKNPHSNDAIFYKRQLELLFNDTPSETADKPQHKTHLHRGDMDAIIKKATHYLKKDGYQIPSNPKTKKMLSTLFSANDNMNALKINAMKSFLNKRIMQSAYQHTNHFFLHTRKSTAQRLQNLEISQWDKLIAVLKIEYAALQSDDAESGMIGNILSEALSLVNKKTGVSRIEIEKNNFEAFKHTYAYELLSYVASRESSIGYKFGCFFNTATTNEYQHRLDQMGKIAHSLLSCNTVAEIQEQIIPQLAQLESKLFHSRSPLLTIFRRFYNDLKDQLKTQHQNLSRKMST